MWMVIYLRLYWHFHVWNNNIIKSGADALLFGIPGIIVISFMYTFTPFMYMNLKKVYKSFTIHWIVSQEG